MKRRHEVTEVRTGSGTLVRRGGLGRDPFAVRETVNVARDMAAFYEKVDADLLRDELALLTRLRKGVRR